MDRECGGRIAITVFCIIVFADALFNFVSLCYPHNQQQQYISEDHSSNNILPQTINNCTTVNLTDHGDLFVSVCDGYSVDIRRFLRDFEPGPVGINISPYEFEIFLTLIPWIRNQLVYYKQ
jgi:hypothetical protein